MAKQFEVAYNSDLIIRDPSEAATLCVFYDRVFLPYTDKNSSRELLGHSGIREEFNNEVQDWEVSYGTLFDEGVLARLPPAIGRKEITKKEYIRTFIEYPRDVRRDVPWAKVLLHGGELLGDSRVPPYVFDNPKTDDLDGLHFEFDEYNNDQVVLEAREVMVSAWYRGCRHLGKKWYQCRVLTVKQVESVVPRHGLDISIDSRISDLLSLHVDKYESGKRPLIRRDLARHLLRDDISIPQIFAPASGRSSQDILVAFEATATFRYLLPKVITGHPSQILDLREKVKDTREGFAMHLWKLSSGLEDRAKEGTSLNDTARFAEDLIKTELIPDYREFKRQFESMRTEKWGKFLDAAGKVAEIDAAPWTPKFWALVLKAVGMTLVKSESEKKEELSNKYQAFKFMNYVERSSLKV